MTAGSAHEKVLPLPVREALIASGVWEELVASGALAHLNRSTVAALQLIGAWSDLDWDEVQDSLARIRHESTPTPPIELA